MVLTPFDWKGNNIINFGITCFARTLNFRFWLKSDISWINDEDLKYCFEQYERLLKSLSDSRIDIDETIVDSKGNFVKKFVLYEQHV